MLRRKFELIPIKFGFFTNFKNLLYYFQVVSEEGRLKREELEKRVSVH